MPRIPRKQLPSPAWYHVICRGVEQRAIVLDDRDRAAWFALFTEVQRRHRWKVHAWILLDNHFHLLIETTQPELSKGMQRLNAVHAMRFNRRYERSGHLFQGRFEARVVEGDRHLAAVIAYIYENATRVGLRGWPWRGIVLPARDYACPGDDGGDETQRAPGRPYRTPERRRRDPPRRRARPVQRPGGARGSARALRGAAGAARGRPRRGGFRRLDRARGPDRGPHQAREPPAVPPGRTGAGDAPRALDLGPGPALGRARYGRRGARGEAELALPRAIG